MAGPVTGSGDIFTVRAQYRIFGQSDVAYNILHYRMRSVTDTATGLPAAISVPIYPAIDAFLTAFTSGWGNAWQPFGSAEVVFDAASMQRIFPNPRSELVTMTLATPWVGVVAGESLPMQDAVTILKRTGFGEKWARGRSFIPGIPESRADKGRITAAGVSSISALETYMGGSIEVNDATYTYLFDPVLWNPVKISGGYLKLTSCHLSDDIIKSMKTRRPGKGI